LDVTVVDESVSRAREADHRDSDAVLARETLCLAIERAHDPPADRAQADDPDP
jgi:hypothetical protein